MAQRFSRAWPAWVNRLSLGQTMR